MVEPGFDPSQPTSRACSSHHSAPLFFAVFPASVRWGIVLDSLAILSGGSSIPGSEMSNSSGSQLTSDRARMAPRPQGGHPVSPPFCSAFSFLKYWLLTPCVLPAVLTTGAQM